MIPPMLARNLALPVIAAPMLLVSGPELVIACCRSGVIGSFPGANARTPETLAAWLDQIGDALADGMSAAFALNIIVRETGSERLTAELALAERHRIPLIITSVGHPGAVVERVHGYGGLVFHDVATLRHAEKAIEAGVDGLILLTAGAGGHTGSANGFAFVRQIRAMWDGMIALAGGIGDGRAVRAAEVLGADFAYMGTRFAATRESMAPPAYKELLVSQRMADIVITDRISGLPATFMRGSIVAAGLDPDDLPAPIARFKPNLPEGTRPWRDIWSAGHGVGSIDDIPPAAELIARLRAGYAA
ncbi:nitronate monooxygenase [Rhizorhabdus wittichii]|uniref:Nitronate monooxygenase n=1 Tax=Rhizorhabdus wittichii TaxID=160791 RepID=A0A975HD87_9SPHN|nr:nitronate monooxygenase [Rhizorhabdus wittichii]QTH21165.1 nitronate monooxygenase [Rhizorhabdus wittichii]